MLNERKIHPETMFWFYPLLEIDFSWIKSSIDFDIRNMPLVWQRQNYNTICQWLGIDSKVLTGKRVIFSRLLLLRKEEIERSILLANEILMERSAPEESLNLSDRRKCKRLALALQCKRKFMINKQIAADSIGLLALRDVLCCEDYSLWSRFKLRFSKNTVVVFDSIESKMTDRCHLTTFWLCIFTWIESSRD